MSPLLYCECGMCGLALKEIGRVKKAKSRYSFNNAMKNEIFTRENFFHEISDELRPFPSHSFTHNKKNLLLSSPSPSFSACHNQQKKCIFYRFCSNSVKINRIWFHLSFYDLAFFRLMCGFFYAHFRIFVSNCNLLFFHFLSFSFLSLMTKLSTWGVVRTLILL